MDTKRKKFNEGQVDTGLCFVAGLFFLTIAVSVVYVSHFGLSPLPQAHKITGMSAVAVLSLPEFTPISDESVSAHATPNEAQNQAFISSLTSVPVKEIFIGSYGTVDKETLEGLQSDLENTLRVKTTILNPGPAVPKEEPFYDKHRNQYNSDVLLKSIEQSSAPYGQTVRFLYVVDIDMASFFEWSPGAPWIRADNGQNAALVSLHAFHANTSGSASQKVPQQTVSERAKKAALRALGITVGFDVSPSVANAACIMYPVLTLEALDAQGNTFCSPELEAAPQVFK